jgi:outer membrane protein OmpA-like peptidoglycan-associated protein
MKTTRALALVLPIAAAATACAHAPDTSQQLTAARQAYGQAANGPARAYAPDSLQVARSSLIRAEQANQMSDTKQRSFAILAHTRAEVADARGRAALAVQERDDARTRLAQAETQQALRVAAECQGQQRQGVTAPQSQGQNALDSIADRKEIIGGGTVYIISSGMQFDKNQATLTPETQSKLDKVADAIKAEPPKTTVVVEGFTDTTGGPAINNPLSVQRARAVADYLHSRGVNQQIRTRGLGESQPVGSNASHQGRTMNRRVQLIVSPR